MLCISPKFANTVILLGLKILVICFEDELSTEWFKIFNAIDKIVDNDVGMWTEEEVLSPLYLLYVFPF